MDRNTVSNYLPLLETVFLTRELPARSRNPLGKVIRHPKGFVCDTGLVASMHGVTAESLAQPIAPLQGRLVAMFVHNELVKQRTWSDSRVNLYHWRDRGGAEIDLVVEAVDGRVFGIECTSGPQRHRRRLPPATKCCRGSWETSSATAWCSTSGGHRSRSAPD